MTPREAKELSLEVWEYLTAHPEISSKYQLPEEIWLKIHNLAFNCPLCDLRLPKDVVCSKDHEVRLDCTGCPLELCYMPNGAWHAWNDAFYDETRKAAANKIVETIRAWEPEKEV